MNLTLNNKLREFCMRLRNLVDEGKTDEEIYAEKNSMIEQIYRIVSICLGTPPEVRELSLHILLFLNFHFHHVHI